MSAIDGPTDGPVEVIQVLFVLYPNFGAQELCGPLEVLSSGLQKLSDPGKSHNPLLPLSNLRQVRHTKLIRSPSLESHAFECTIAAPSPAVTSSSGLTVKADIDYKTAHDDLHYYDVLILPGGKGVQTYLTEENKEPIPLLQAYAKLQQNDPSKERTLMSIGTASLVLAQAGLLQGLAATTHPDSYTKLEIICKEAARKGNLEQTDVMEENYVVNNARFDLGEDVDENPYILHKRPDGRRKSLARKGSNAWKESVKRRESNARRATLKLGGMRLITSGGVTSGLDASLYLVAAMASHEASEEVARQLQYSWNKGVTVEGIDV